ncbi:MAG: DUF4830 domain-containing protein [Oscillospiraceae bacterium]|nr:DUF4830 domain-containing protein [Oscillospiraceae bacterium]
MKHSLCKFAAAAVTAAAALLLYPRLTQQDTPDEQIILADSSAREAWLNLRGWQVGEPEITEIRLPQSWQSDAGQSWLRLQTAQGLYPERFAGRDAVRCLYPVADEQRQHLFAELLLCDNILVGAQVYDAGSGLMQSVR